MMALYIVVTIAGMIAGILLLTATKHAIARRIEALPSLVLVYGSNAIYIWSFACGFAWLTLYLCYGISFRMFEIIYALSACIVLSVVDICTRKIPNQVLLLLIAGAIGLLIVKGDWTSVSSHLLGAVLGVTVFLAPSLLVKQAGMGDIKLAGVTGFYLGVRYTMVALVIMSVLFLIVAGFLIATRRGTLKSAVAFGPYISAGFVIALILPR